MACADGVIHENEISLLAELAGNLGLETEVASNIIDHAPRLSFFIPSQPEDRRQELHRVVLMMITDGVIHEKEYAQCRKLAEAMEISVEYLDKVVQHYQTKQQEHIQHLEILQNIFLVAIADGQLSPAEHEFLLDVADSLELSADDLDFLIENHETLDFIIPEDEQEKLFTLKNLVYMMLVDGEIDPGEYEICLSFAHRVGMGRKEIEEILEEYEILQKSRSEHQTEIDNLNVDICLDIFLNIARSEISVADIIGIIAEMEANPNLPDQENHPEYPRFLLEFFWLIHVRAGILFRENKTHLPMLLDVSLTENNFHALRDHIINIEQTYGATEIPLSGMTDSQIIRELNNYFQRI
ncbi:MAG: TerB family tellurite resistance protein [Bacteroidia bacterium]